MQLSIKEYITSWHQKVLFSLITIQLIDKLMKFQSQAATTKHMILPTVDLLALRLWLKSLNTILKELPLKNIVKSS